MYVEKQSDCNDQKLGYLHVVAKNPTDKFEWEHDPTLLTGNAENLTKGFYKLKMKDENGFCERDEILQVHSYTPVFKKLEIGGISHCVTDSFKTGFISIELDYDYPESTTPDFNDPIIHFTNNGVLYTYIMGSGMYVPGPDDWDGRIHGVPHSGPLTLFIYDHGCGIDTTILIPVLDDLTYSLLTSTPHKETQLYSAFSQPKGGQNPYTYLWSDGNTDANRTDLKTGKTYYVTVTDVYGCTSTSKTFIKKKKGAKKFQLINNQLNIQVRTEEVANVNTLQFQVFDSFGKAYSLTQSTFSEEEWQIDISKLAAGIYFMSVVDGDGIESYPFAVMR